ncbi:g8900 [Coccomyxa viridis]|uniref:G8900 protein n=1 Tax=Coccomyxa viridis TaxID=1274662 RepID=A0ABP1G1J1_9CHLO
MDCFGRLHDAEGTHGDGATAQDETSNHCLDFWSWLESEFEIDAIQSNETFDWVSPARDGDEMQHMRSSHVQMKPLHPQHHASASKGAPLAHYAQPKGERFMPILDLEGQARVTGAISGFGPDIGLLSSSIQSTLSQNHLALAGLDKQDKLSGSAFTPANKFETQDPSQQPDRKAKLRLRWTPELDSRFVQAMQKLEVSEKATPKSILKLMAVDGLTIYHIKSRLQKYRVDAQHSGRREDMMDAHPTLLKQSKRRRGCHGSSSQPQGCSNRRHKPQSRSFCDNGNRSEPDMGDERLGRDDQGPKEHQAARPCFSTVFSSVNGPKPKLVGSLHGTLLQGGAGQADSSNRKALVPPKVSPFELEPDAARHSLEEALLKHMGMTKKMHEQVEAQRQLQQELQQNRQYIRSLLQKHEEGCP